MQEGMIALWRGWLPSVIGVIPYVGLNFSVYETLKDMTLKAYGECTSASSSLPCHLITIIVMFIVFSISLLSVCFRHSPTYMQMLKGTLVATSGLDNEGHLIVFIVVHASTLSTAESM